MSGTRGGQRSCFGTYFHMQKVKNWGQGGNGPQGPPRSATAMIHTMHHMYMNVEYFLTKAVLLSKNHAFSVNAYSIQSLFRGDAPTGNIAHQLYIILERYV